MTEKKPQKTSKSLQRKQKLSAALQSNIRRRKEQTRQRSTTDKKLPPLRPKMAGHPPD